MYRHSVIFDLYSWSTSEALNVQSWGEIEYQKMTSCFVLKVCLLRRVTDAPDVSSRRTEARGLS